MEHCIPLVSNYNKVINYCNFFFVSTFSYIIFLENKVVFWGGRC